MSAAFDAACAAVKTHGGMSQSDQLALYGVLFYLKKFFGVRLSIYTLKFAFYCCASSFLIKSIR